MVSTLRVEDRLERATNFRAWKARILLLLVENDLKDYVEMVVPEPKVLRFKLLLGFFSIH
jgi:hypothetical protein